MFTFTRSALNHGSSFTGHLACCPGLYPLRRILQVLLDAGGRRAPWPLPCDVDLKVRGGERRWSVTLLRASSPAPTPPPGSPFRSPARGSALDPYAVSSGRPLQGPRALPPSTQVPPPASYPFPLSSGPSGRRVLQGHGHLLGVSWCLPTWHCSRSSRSSSRYSSSWAAVVPWNRSTSR